MGACTYSYDAACTYIHTYSVYVCKIQCMSDFDGCTGYSVVFVYWEIVVDIVAMVDKAVVE